MSGSGYPTLYITLFGPRNETLFGELNMTGMTLPRKDTRFDDAGVAASSSSFVRSGYDSRGAAYYICIVILVYALAIAAFVVSLARRRNARDKYRLAHDQIPADYQPREERRQGGCWKQRCSASSEFPGAPSSPWSSSSSSSTSSNSGIAHQRPEALKEGRQMVATAEGLTSSINAQIDPDEVITLVQVWPYTTTNSSSSSSNEGLKMPDADGGALYCHEDDGTVTPGGGTQELEAGQKRFRWSMGPDGNIWILQMDDSVVINNAKNNNDNTPTNNNLGCQLQPITEHLGPNQPSKDTPFVQSCPSSATAVKGALLSSGVNAAQQAKADQRRPKNLAFSPVPRGYRPRGRSSSRERKTRQLLSDEQGLKTTTLPTENDPCSNTGEKLMNSSLLIAREQHWEEYHFLDPEPFCLPPMVSPHLMQKLIHVTSV